MPPLGGPRQKESRGGLVVAIVVVLALLVGGYFGWKQYLKHAAAERARQAELLRQQQEEEARRRAELEALGKKKPVEAPKPVVEAPKPPPPKPKKSEAELWQEEVVARKAALAAVEAARGKAGKPLGGLGGIKFGSVLEAAPVRWGTVRDGLDAANVTSNGVTFAVYGPKFAKSFLSFGAQPLVWVTPKTHRVCRIEIARPVKTAAGSVHDAETQKALDALKTRFACDPIAVSPLRPERLGCEYVFPLGETTVKVGEYGGTLKLTAQSETVLREALAESETVRQETAKASVEDEKLLDSKRYPHRPIDMQKYPGVKFKEGTPKSFCGVVFGSQPPESVPVVNPKNGEKGFFLDYEKANCRPFLWFDRGKAEIDRWRGGVFAVNLYCEGGAGGLDDRDLFARARAELDAHYQVKAEEKKGTGEYPTLKWTIADLVVTLGPDERGGFYLRAEQQVLASLSRVDPAQARARRRK